MTDWLFCRITSTFHMLFTHRIYQKKISNRKCIIFVDRTEKISQERLYWNKCKFKDVISSQVKSRQDEWIGLIYQNAHRWNPFIPRKVRLKSEIWVWSINWKNRFIQITSDSTKLYFIGKHELQGSRIQSSRLEVTDFLATNSNIFSC